MEFSKQYYDLLVGFIPEITSISKKIIENNVLASKLGDTVNDMPRTKFLQSCMIYDLCQITKALNSGQDTKDALQITGFALSVGTLLPIASFDIAAAGYEQVAGSHTEGVLAGIAEAAFTIGNIDNPLKINASNRQDNIEVSSTDIHTQLSLPAALKLINLPVFEPYAAMLYRYANIIAKADESISKEEEDNLKKIYKLVYDPAPGQKGETATAPTEEITPVDEVIQELDALIGLQSVKQELNTLVNFIKVQKARTLSGLATPPISYHMVFTGNPGTGKTTVARIVAKIYKALDILLLGQLIETDRSGLVAEYVGQTAIKVNETIDTALNGILFIDEAYALVADTQNDYGKEALATLVKRMEDDRDKLVVIMAGYTGEMKNFIETNPGLRSRVNRYIEFPDYSPAELLAIYEAQCKKADYIITDDAKTKLAGIFEMAYAGRDRTFGNGRFARNIFEKSLERQANRIAGIASLTKEILTSITADDIP